MAMVRVDNVKLIKILVSISTFTCSVWCDASHEVSAPSPVVVLFQVSIEWWDWKISSNEHVKKNKRFPLTGGKSNQIVIS